MSAQDRLARKNLVNSLVAGIAAAGGVNAATATGAAQIEVENNQVSIVDWAKRTYESPVEDIARWAREFAGKVASNNGQTPPSDADPLADATNGKPPTGAAARVLRWRWARLPRRRGMCRVMRRSAAEMMVGIPRRLTQVSKGNISPTTIILFRAEAN
jgi:hypothetical protein